MSTSHQAPAAPLTDTANDAVVSPPVTTNEPAVVAVEDKPETTEATPAATDNVADAPASVDNAEGISQKGKQKETAPESVKDQDDAIGPAQDEIKAPASEPNSPPVCNITLLLTTGSRHPYKLDAKYLARRNVAIPENTEQGQPDPFSISIYTLKELILREWRSDWETKPASPSSIRLIHFGKLLDDKEPLKKYQFSTEAPNVVHMSIRPQDLDEEEPKSGSKALGGGLSEDGTTRSRGLCCVIL